MTGDKREHHIAERPRNAPTRTAIGAAGVVFYAVLWAAASSDLIATHFKLTIEGVITTLQVLLIVAPILAFIITKRTCSLCSVKIVRLRSTATRAAVSCVFPVVSTSRFTNNSTSTSAGDSWTTTTTSPLPCDPTTRDASPWEPETAGRNVPLVL